VTPSNELGNNPEAHALEGRPQRTTLRSNPYSAKALRQSNRQVCRPAYVEAISAVQEGDSILSGHELRLLGGFNGSPQKDHSVSPPVKEFQ
jgi:hypothetical protein